MKTFLDHDFLLDSGLAVRLYDDCAAKMPVVDYHCHLSPEEIRDDKRFSTITQVWLSGDHYKWRLMRAAGCDENLVTGDAPDEEKFRAWARTLAKAIGNPLYHWSHLELARYFDYHGLLNEDTADEVYAHCNQRLRAPSMSARGLISSSHVTHLCTTDDPVDDLHFHAEIASDDTFQTRVLPAWRPDRALHIEKEDFAEYLRTLSEVSGVEVTDFSSLKDALKNRLDYFASKGSSVSDHGLDFVPYREITDAQADALLKRRLKGETLTADECAAFISRLLLFLGKEYAKRHWVMQLHFGVQRNLSPLLFASAGADAGGDAIGHVQPATELAGFLGALEKEDLLPKTILYSLNPTENVMIETIMGSFQKNISGKLQHGSAWWFNDHEQGMRDQLSSLASQGMLATFVGMLTDSRSFLSYARHEYFRRVLCNLIGGWVESGRFPDDDKRLKTIIEDICYNNAVRYFGFQ